MSVLICHINAPVYFILDSQIPDNETETTIPIISCQISSNIFFYTTLLSELSISKKFSAVLYRLLVQSTQISRTKINRTRLKYIFSRVRYYRNTIHLQVRPDINRYDEWINRHWASVQLHVLKRRIHYESSWAWLSTLGGGYSCLGEISLRHAKEAETISKSQICLSAEIGDPNALVKAYLFLALSYMQQKRYGEARTILQFQYRRIHQKDITDDRLSIMCIALWKKMKYVIKRERELN